MSGGGGLFTAAATWDYQTTLTDALVLGSATELAGAGVELLNPTATPSDIAEAVMSILQDESLQEEMSARERSWAIERDPAYAAHELLSALDLIPNRP